ncbi:bacillithiol biosynthesis cysteine-adding enzyme BshC [Owenweeksia hongkongensis]|uniref:bacillithiol biosynthesis cysteine-adding enzyme BshC n=1 Tax=Owenweeksia hongkongensis TaxID=253245 RepID=UPI003A90F819
MPHFLLLPSMDDTHCLNYRNTGYFSKLICDYLDQDPTLKPFYNRFPNLENFKDQIEEKSSFTPEGRKMLVEALLEQYSDLGKSSDTSKTLENIQLLADGKTFTVTTGHQLNLFTGPLYFLYKIVSTINLSRELKKAYPENNFVPVYWMATEDHDFEEINFINLFGGRLRWNRESGGPVGRFSTEDIEPLIKELNEHLGPGSFAKEFCELLKTAYSEGRNLAEATRYLVHHLFGEHGLVIVDGDSSKLKTLMQPLFKDELLKSASHEFVSKTTSKLEEVYFQQVHPRDINLFYIADGLRERIEKRDGRWYVLNTKLEFSEEEIIKELNDNPERFSPNVILRPLYQEVILPNLAYIGGGGELAYWFQLKDMFDAFKIPFPMLMLRNSALWVPAKEKSKLDDMGLKVSDLFYPLHEVKKNYVSEHAPVDVELDPYQQKLQQMFDELEDVANLTDKSMLGAVNAQRQKQLNGLDNLKKKLIRAEKRRQSDQMEKLERVYFALFPKGSLQERHDNLSVYFSEYGPAFIEQLFESLDPLDYRFRVITEKELV